MGYWPVVEDMMDSADILIVLMDARMPEMSRNSEIERKILKKGKESVDVFTKMDLITPANLKLLREKYPKSFFVSGTKNIGVSDLRRHLQIMAKRMGIEEPKIGVVGYPNLGKSALINALARRARAAVADMPNTTRGVQWVRAGGLRILDSPGVIPYEDKSTKLTILGSKHPEKISDPMHVALQIIRMFTASNKAGLEKAYNVEIKELTEPYDIMLEIGKKRGFLKKGGEVEETKTAITIVKDWQKGKLVL
jgi:ribosome biogenesis GTPase A